MEKRDRVRGIHHHSHAWPIEGICHIVRKLRHEWATRSWHPWLAVVAVPLAMIPATLSGEWWAWPLLALCAAGWSPGQWELTPLGVEEGVIGSMWAYDGANAWVACPDAHLLVASIWIAFPLALALVGWWFRHRPMSGSGALPLRATTPEGEKTDDLLSRRAA